MCNYAHMYVFFFLFSHVKQVYRYEHVAVGCFAKYVCVVCDWRKGGCVARGTRQLRPGYGRMLPCAVVRARMYVRERLTRFTISPLIPRQLNGENCAAVVLAQTQAGKWRYEKARTRMLPRGCSHASVTMQV